MASTATGSTAETSAAKTKHGSSSNSTPPYSGVKLKPQSVRPIVIVLKRVFTIANNRIVPRLSKKGLYFLFFDIKTYKDVKYGIIK